MTATRKPQKVREILITATCIACRVTKDIDESESERLTKDVAVPICDKCGMPMIARTATLAPSKGRKK